MKINKISGKNFMSFHEIQLDFDKLGNGLILVDGWNYDDSSASGSGKTSLLDLISFTLFGQSPRGIKVNEFVNDSASKGCVAHMDMTMDNGQHLAIERTRKPEDLWYQIDDNTPVRDVDLRKTQQLLEDLLKLDFNTFQSSVYFSRSTAIKFISASDNDKRDILTRILDVSDFDKAYEIAAEKLKAHEQIVQKNLTEVSKFSYLLDSIEKDINNAEKQSVSFEEDRNEEIARKLRVKASDEYEIKQSLENIELLKKETPVSAIAQPLPPVLPDVSQPDYTLIDQRILVLQEKITTMELVKSKQEDFQKIIYAAEMQKKRYAKEIEVLQDVGEGKCSRCNQIVTAEHLDQEIQQIKILINENDTTLTKDKAKLAKVNTVLEDAKRFIIETEALKQQKINLEKEYNNQLMIVERLNNTYNMEISEFKNALQMQEVERNNIAMKINNFYNDIQKREKNLKSLEQEILTVKERKNGWLSTIKAKQAERTEMMKTIKDLEDKNLTISQDIETLTTLKNAYKNIKYYIFETTVDELNRRIGKYLEPLFNEDIKISYIYKSGKNNDKLKFDVVIEKNGVIKSFESLSDGEKKRAELATNFALSDIVAMRKSNSLSLIILDEIADGMPAECRERLVELLSVLKQEKDTILIVDHFKEVHTLIENVIKIEKKDSISRITQ